MKPAESLLNMNLLLPLLFCLIQDTQPATTVQGPEAVVPLPSDPEAKLDVVVLKNGDELVGSITAELDGYVEIAIEDGATVGISRAQVKEVRQRAVAAPLKAAVVRADDAWFVQNFGHRRYDWCGLLRDWW